MYKKRPCILPRTRFYVCTLNLSSSSAKIPLYLNDRLDVEGVHLLNKCRLECLWTVKAIAKTVKDHSMNATCRICHYGHVEDVFFRALLARLSGA